ncbi:hypothetical protein F4805DRAFT_463203 [Annulohypoxylon moriforme]|nr:hypothetical protein F4805DRAFT_463203 [Annulohypoxylon moriforme]
MKRFVKYFADAPDLTRTRPHTWQESEYPSALLGQPVFPEGPRLASQFPAPQIKLRAVGLWRFLSNMTKAASKAPGSGKRKRPASIEGLLSPSSLERWYTSDEVKVEDCNAFDSTGNCDQWNLVREEESDASGLCDDCTREHHGDA